jgi:hypothetical protein
MNPEVENVSDTSLSFRGTDPAKLQTAIDHPAALQVARAVVSSAAEKLIAVEASRISP